MIIPNFVVGKDDARRILQCGDICEFKAEIERPKCYKRIEELKGMIVYDESSYSFAFITLDDYVPILLMKCAEYRTIRKLYSVTELDSFQTFPVKEKEAWKEIYNNHLFNYCL